MGFSVSWLAYLHVPKPVALAAVGLRDTEAASPWFHAPFQAAELPIGWTVVFANDALFADPDRLEVLSRDHAVLGCMVEDHAMVCMAFQYVRGENIWTVASAGFDGPMKLETSGQLPPEFEMLRARAVRKQDDPGSLAGYELPVDLVQSVCGFRHDALQTAPFTVAEKA